MSEFNGPGEYVGYIGGKIGGAVIGGNYGGRAGAVVGQDVGGRVGKKMGGGLDAVVNSQSQQIKKEYDRAKSQGMNHQKASNYALDVTGFKDN